MPSSKKSAPSSPTLTGALVDGSDFVRRLSSATRKVRIDEPRLARVDLSAAASLARWNELYLRSDSLLDLDLRAASGKGLERVQLVLAETVASLDIRPLGDCPTLIELSISGGPTHLDLAPLSGLQHLSKLLLYGSALASFDAASVAACPSLSVVWLMQTAIESLMVRVRVSLRARSICVSRD